MLLLCDKLTLGVELNLKILWSWSTLWCLYVMWGWTDGLVDSVLGLESEVTGLITSLGTTLSFHCHRIRITVLNPWRKLTVPWGMQWTILKTSRWLSDAICVKQKSRLWCGKSYLGLSFPIPYVSWDDNSEYSVKITEGASSEGWWLGSCHRKVNYMLVTGVMWFVGKRSQPVWCCGWVWWLQREWIWQRRRQRGETWHA